MVEFEMKLLRQLNCLVRARADRHVVLGIKHPIPLAQVDGLVIAQSNNDFYVDWYNADTTDFLKVPRNPSPKVIWLQSWWDTPSEKLTQLISNLRAYWPHARLIYLDWFAPTDLRNSYLIELCDIYVKKNMLLKADAYERGFCDTNLVEYETQFNESFKGPCHVGVSSGLVNEKVRLGWSFATQKRLVKLLDKQYAPESNRDIALHCRMAAPSNVDNWYAHMRMRAFQSVNKLKFDGVLAESKALPWKKYIEELTRSKMCFSPFGFGEVCWRDFEAIATGSMLIKPDMSHMAVSPNVFIPSESYVSVDWEFSTLESVCMHYLNDDKARIKLVKRAQEVWKDYLGSDLAKQIKAIYL